MKRSVITGALLIALVAVIVLVIQVRGVGAPTPLAYAGASDNVTGYAWSSNIGWVSFNCTNDNSCAGNNYGVNVSPSTGNFSGDAWSSSVGWISFNETTGCPESGCTTQPRLDKTTGIVTGWARACAGTVNGNCTGGSRSDGWDGWIKLSGVTFTGIGFDGYAWGSDVVGWLSWSGSTYQVISTANVFCTSKLTPSSYSINKGQAITLSWSTIGGAACAATCTGNGFNTGGATSGSGVSPTVQPTPPSTSYALTCSGGTHGSPPPANATVTVIAPIVTITANNQSVSTRVNQTVPNNATIFWSATGATTCSLTKNGSAWQSGVGPTSVVDSVTVQTVYGIDCQDSYGSHTITSVTVDIIPIFTEF